MKALKIIGLGIGIWGLSLGWPEINLLLTPGIMVGAGVVLGTVLSIYTVFRYTNRSRNVCFIAYSQASVSNI
jgi:hypothetical protein